MRDDAWLARATDRYHELCADPALGGPQVVADFVRRQLDAGLTFGGMVQCRSLRPAFISLERLEVLQEAVTTLYGALRVIETRALTDPVLAADLGLSADEQALAAIDPGYEAATVVSRLDAYFNDVPRVLEYNADSPAGMSYQAGQAAIVRTLPVMERFAGDFELRELRADLALRDTLLSVWREFAAKKQLAGRLMPRVAIVDLAGAATGPEFCLVRDDLQAHGMPAVIATPEDLRYDGGELLAGGQRIDLVYKRLLVADFLARYDLRHPLVRAYADGAVCMASSFRCCIAQKKRVLEVLCDPRRAGWFSQAQRTAIGRMVPATQGYHTGRRAELESSRASWALKPNDAHGGEGVTLGWVSDAAQWSRALDTADHGDYVVQERLEPRASTYPVFDAHDPQRGAILTRLIEDCNAYVFRGSLGGILTRLSEDPVINVSRGGQAIPTFVVSPR